MSGPAGPVDGEETTAPAESVAPWIAAPRLEMLE